MKMKLRLFVSAFLAMCLFILSFSGCSSSGKSAQTPAKSGTTQQGRNIIGENLQGANPNAGAGKTGSPDGNRNLGTGNKLLDMTGKGISPNTTANINIGMLGQQVQFNRQKADNIKKQLGSMPEIRNVNVIVKGNAAVVGYNPSSASKDTRAVKNMISNKVKQIDKSVTNVMVSDSPDILKKLNQLSSDISKNKPVNDLNSLFNQLVQSISSTGR